MGRSILDFGTPKSRLFPQRSPTDLGYKFFVVGLWLGGMAGTIFLVAGWQWLFGGSCIRALFVGSNFLVVSVAALLVAKVLGRSPP